jgi:hypothetical protein
MSTLNARKCSLCMIVASAFGVLACVSIALLLATALWVSSICNSGLIFLVALCSVPLTALFCLAVKILDTKLAEYQAISCKVFQTSSSFRSEVATR